MHVFQLTNHSWVILYCIWNTIKTQHISQTATLMTHWWEKLLKNKWNVFLLRCDTFLAKGGVSLPPTINSEIYTCELLRFYPCITLLQKSVIKHIWFYTLFGLIIPYLTSFFLTNAKWRFTPEPKIHIFPLICRAKSHQDHFSVSFGDYNCCFLSNKNGAGCYLVCVRQKTHLKTTTVMCLSRNNDLLQIVSSFM